MHLSVMLMRTSHHGYPTDRRRRWLVRLLVLLVAAFVISGMYLALASRHDVAHVGPVPARVTASSPARPATVPSLGGSLAPIARTGDPRTFAVEVAQALFAWDTNSPIALSDYTGRLVAVADPTGVESPGLVADVATYMPTTTAWSELKTYRTRQWLEVTAASVPVTWADAAAEGKSFGLAAGTTAYTISGVRHRAGVWDGRTVQTEHEVSFTVFTVCGPSYPTCHLLRISKLDDPLR